MLSLSSVTVGVVVVTVVSCVLAESKPVQNSDFRLYRLFANRPAAFQVIEPRVLPKRSVPASESESESPAVSVVAGMPSASQARPYQYPYFDESRIAIGFGKRSGDANAAMWLLEKRRQDERDTDNLAAETVIRFG